MKKVRGKKRGHELSYRVLNQKGGRVLVSEKLSLRRRKAVYSKAKPLQAELCCFPTKRLGSGQTLFPGTKKKALTQEKERNARHNSRKGLEVSPHLSGEGEKED